MCAPDIGANMITSSVSFRIKYLNNRHVIGRCCQILEYSLLKKLGKPDDCNVKGLPLEIAKAITDYVNWDDLNGHPSPNEFALSLNQEHSLKFTAYVAWGDCIFVEAEVVDDIV